MQRTFEEDFIVLYLWDWNLFDNKVPRLRAVESTSKRTSLSARTYGVIPQSLHRSLDHAGQKPVRDLSTRSRGAVGLQVGERGKTTV